METGEVVVVVQKNDHSLGFFDFATGKELARVIVPDYPHEFVISPDGRYAYSCHFGLKLAEDEGPGGNEISVVDLLTAKHVRSIACNGWRRPHGIAFDGAGGLYVLSEGTSRLLVIPDPVAGSIVRTLPTGGFGSHILSVTRNGALAFCSNMRSSSVSVLALRGEGLPPRILHVGERPEGSAFDASEQRLLVCNRESADVSVIDVARQEVTGRIETPPGPVRIARRGDAEFVVACYHDQSLIVIDANRGQVTQRVALPGKPVSVGLDPRSGLALAGLLPSGLSVVNLDSGEVVRTIATRDGPDPMAVIRLPLVLSGA
jgi:YVTN family beta-propeller protein